MVTQKLTLTDPTSGLTQEMFHAQEPSLCLLLHVMRNRPISAKVNNAQGYSLDLAAFLSQSRVSRTTFWGLESLTCRVNRINKITRGGMTRGAI